MKKVLFLGIVSAGLLTSCSTAKIAQVDRAEFMKLKGDWKITSVNYDQNYKVKPFDEGADAQCWVGSTWRLIPNNYTGSYTIHGGDNCPSVTQPIKFEVLNGSQFQFKKIADGTKAKQNTMGYVLNMIGQTENTFTLQQNIPFGGENVQITYTFQRESR